MEFVDGVTLDEWLRAAPRTWREILDVFMSAGRGLAAAHAADIVHRDFKPQNVMIGRNGGVRVMDFGLASLVGDGADAGGDVAATLDARANDSPQATVRVTRTGTLLGTPAYMAPEQFANDSIDARADQYSFCVAMHEALFGKRPLVAESAESGKSDGTNVRSGELPSLHSVRSRPPSWVRAILRRGVATDQHRRFPSMEPLLRELNRGMTRQKRRNGAVIVTLTSALVAFAVWRGSHPHRFDCRPPRDRVAAAWAIDDTGHSRRRSVHQTFVASGRPTAEISWQRVSEALDIYIAEWSAMYSQTCEATQILGEQSGEVLDLRMSCLTDNLDQVRALTDQLSTANDEAVAHALAATQDLTPVSRCADVALLRSTVPPPRDQRTLEAVRSFAQTIRDLRAQRVLGYTREAHRKALALRARVEAIGYKPLLAQLLELIGSDVEYEPARAEVPLEDAFFTAIAARDDETAAMAASTLVYATGYGLGRIKDAEQWARLATTILDRSAVDQGRIRGWTLQNLACAYAQTRDFEKARLLLERAVLLKEKALGRDHPDVAISLSALSSAMTELGRPQEAFELSNRAVEIYMRHGDPDTRETATAFEDRGVALSALGRYPEAENDLERALKIFERAPESTHPAAAEVLQALGEISLAQRDAAGAVALVERALAISEPVEIDRVLVADRQFLFARALWESSGNHQRALALAKTAKATFAKHHDQRRERLVTDWLAAHRITRTWTGRLSAASRPDAPT
jgi:serine/threonine protein kinase